MISDPPRATPVASFASRPNPERTPSLSREAQSRSRVLPRFRVMAASCVICFDHDCAGLDRQPDGVWCNAGHYTCASCVESQVRHAAAALGAVSDLVLKADAADVRTRHKYAGRHLCASIGCTSEPIDDSEIARVTSRTTFAAFVEAKVLLPTARRVAAVVAEASKGAAREANLLELQLRSEMPAARMCGRCSFGPVDAFGCSDLMGHHGEERAGTRIDNACPACGNFARSIEDWPLWDGVLRTASDCVPQPPAEEEAARRRRRQEELASQRAALEASWLADDGSDEWAREVEWAREAEEMEDAWLWHRQRFEPRWRSRSRSPVRRPRFERNQRHERRFRSRSPDRSRAPPLWRQRSPPRGPRSPPPRHHSPPRLPPLYYRHHSPPRHRPPPRCRSPPRRR